MSNDARFIYGMLHAALAAVSLYVAPTNYEVLLFNVLMSLGWFLRSAEPALMEEEDNIEDE